MHQTEIFGPFLATMGLTLAVWLLMLARRIPFILSLGDVDLSVPGELARLSPAAVSNPSDNLKNLFELPVLFYAVCLYLYATGKVDAAYVAAGWVFFAFRMLHSLVHCTFNHIVTRFSVYLVAGLALWFMLLRAAWGHFGA
jgi:hypothetical protein